MFPDLIITAADDRAIEGVRLAKSLSVNIIHFSCIIDEISLTFCIMPVCCFKNTSSTPMHKSNNAVWTIFASIRRNFDRKYIKGSSTPLCMEGICRTSAICPFFLHHLKAVHGRCGSCIKMQWLSCDIAASRIYSSL